MRKQSCCRRTHDFGPFARGRLVGWAPLFPGFQHMENGGTFHFRVFWNIPGVFFGFQILILVETAELSLQNPLGF